MYYGATLWPWPMQDGCRFIGYPGFVPFLKVNSTEHGWFMKEIIVWPVAIIFSILKYIFSYLDHMLCGTLTPAHTWDLFESMFEPSDIKPLLGM